jgi:putative Mn2+ efflux pump MntP
MDLTIYPTAALYGLLAVITLGFGVGILVYQTASTHQALTTRKGTMFGGVLLIVIGGLVLITQIWATVSASYSHLG